MGPPLLVGCDTPGPGRWAGHAPGSDAIVDHRAWQLFLDRHTFIGADGVTRVAYASIPVVDRELLDDYLAGLQRVPVKRLDRPQQLAFWLNLHNALMVRVVLDHLIARSPDDINLGGSFSRGPWGATLARVEGAGVSLGSIRTVALRPVFQDPRWHYGLCDASLGGPALPRTAFQGESVDRQIEDAAIGYVNHPRAVRVEDGTLLLNAFWRRNLADFGGSASAALSHIAAYADRELRAELQPGRTVRWMDDRRLNEWPGS
ncbi:DUF547 domain-containing protein [Thalassobaculum sp.]|uniref:DUF547 domain-containing protein n=1 Tax=Thalassobaculum sp. TaxID=2022740 RepID=UPI0032EC9AE9